MEFENLNNASFSCLYMTAPNSPNGCNTMELYYSAPASPRRRTGCATFNASDDHLGSTSGEFEFETSKRFEVSEPLLSGGAGREGRGKYRERGDSLPAMAFADELFLNGLVMPLRPPPRLNCDTQFKIFSQKSPFSSPRTACRIPFARKSSWNDDFDPFMVALEKVREDTRGRNSHSRRSRSYSPFRAMSKRSSATADCHSLMEPMPAPSFSGPLDFKGSAYARWVLDQTRHGFRHRVRPLKTKQDVLDMRAPPAGTHDESKLQKLKGVLARYASFGRGNSASKQTKTSSEARKLSYFGRVSFKFKGSAHANSKKKIPDDTNMAVVQTAHYKSSRAFFLSWKPIKVK